jgi:hypothetical protein
VSVPYEAHVHPIAVPPCPAQAAWFFAASAILFEHRPEWSDPSDMAPVMFVPVLYALILLMVAAYMIIGESCSGGRK